MMKTAYLPPGNWILPTAPRFTPLGENEKTPLQKMLLKVTRWQAGTERNLNVFEGLARLGGTFFPYLMFLSQILMKGRIGRVDKELIILRVGWRMGCVYEWGHHVHMAAELGISDSVMHSIAQEDSSDWEPRLATFIRAADELVAQHTLSDDTWAALRGELSEDQAVEFCMLVGHYVMVAGLINTLGIRIEPGYLKDIG